MGSGWMGIGAHRVHTWMDGRGGQGLFSASDTHPNAWDGWMEFIFTKVGQAVGGIEKRHGLLVTHEVLGFGALSCLPVFFIPFSCTGCCCLAHVEGFFVSRIGSEWWFFFLSLKVQVTLHAPPYPQIPPRSLLCMARKTLPWVPSRLVWMVRWDGEGYIRKGYPSSEEKWIIYTFFEIEFLWAVRNVWRLVRRSECFFLSASARCVLFQ
ncbi:hypothetical protein P154DRAFT_230201 [Amniculicola lignicola CBS 123094]|uniref:Uncharacterized protein n=1 Tax=Amniculicola lignicola CBS 123094 TaxID=1392246 RepID=A0A6A5WP42_9PLEO|nr:hypothetical protein P154DRAFT_230201 [Amniculicola lignicola CBS 123094]